MQKLLFYRGQRPLCRQGPGRCCALGPSHDRTLLQQPSSEVNEAVFWFLVSPGSGSKNEQPNRGELSRRADWLLQERRFPNT